MQIIAIQTEDKSHVTVFVNLTLASFPNCEPRNPELESEDEIKAQGGLKGHSDAFTH